MTAELHTVDDDDGSTLGWVVIESWVDGLSFGGLRVSPSVTSEEVHELARTMRRKLAVHASPTGGAKGGLCRDPRAASTLEAARRFGAAIRPLLDRGLVLGKDMGATDTLIAAVYEGAGAPQLAPVLRRSPSGPAWIREIPGFVRHMTGLGVAEAAAAARGGLEGARVLIQGAGAVGIGTAIRMEERGARIVGMSDAQGAVLGERPAALWAAAATAEGLLDRALLPAQRLATRDALFDEPADVLVLAAASHSVEVEHALAINSPLIVEGANFGLTIAAEALLHARGHAVVPDLVASSSSAALVSLQLAAGGSHDPAVLWPRILASIAAATTRALELGQARGLPTKRAWILGEAS